MMIIVVPLNWVDFIVLVEERSFQSGVIYCISLDLVDVITIMIFDGLC